MNLSVSVCRSTTSDLVALTTLIAEYVTLTMRPDAGLGRGYGRATSPTFHGGSWQSRVSYPYGSLDDVDVPDDDDDDDDVARSIAKMTLSDYEPIDSVSSPSDRFAFVTGASRLGETNRTLTRQSIFTLKPRSSRDGIGSLRGWSQPPPPTDADDDTERVVFRLIDFLDAENDLAQLSGKRGRSPLA